MKHLAVALVTIGMLAVGVTTSVSAEEIAPEADEIVIVDFEMDNVDEEVTDNFYGHLRNILAQEDSTSISETGNVSISDLFLMAGCDSAEAECLARMGDFVDGNHLLFGSIDRSEDVYMFTISLFDFETQQMVREINEKTLRGDATWLEQGIPAVIEHLLYGETASVVVDIDGDPNADVQLNGESVATGSTTIEAVAPGEVVVTVTGADGQEHQERFIVRHNERKQLDFELAPAVADIDDPDAPPSLAPGLALGGAGVAGAILGMVGQIQLTGANAEAASIIDGRSAVHADEREQLQQLEGDMATANTMRWIGFGAGVAGLASGGFLLFQAMSHEGSDSANDSLTSTDLDIDFGASQHGVNAGFRLHF